MEGADSALELSLLSSQHSLFFLIGMNSSKTKLELQKHLTTLTNQEQATIFEEVQVQYWFLISRKEKKKKGSFSVECYHKKKQSRPVGALRKWT